MQVTVTGQQLEVTDPMREYAEQKILHLEKYFDKINNVHVVLKTENSHEFIAEANIDITDGHFHAHAKHDDMYAAIDLLADRCATQVRKHKEKMRGHEGGDQLI